MPTLLAHLFPSLQPSDGAPDPLGAREGGAVFSAVPEASWGIELRGRGWEGGRPVTVTMILAQHLRSVEPGVLSGLPSDSPPDLELYPLGARAAAGLSTQS